MARYGSGVRAFWCKFEKGVTEVRDFCGQRSVPGTSGGVTWGWVSAEQWVDGEQSKNCAGEGKGMGKTNGFSVGVHLSER